MVALPLYAYSGLLSQWLGQAHVHREMSADEWLKASGFEERMKNAVSRKAGVSIATSRHGHSHGGGLFERHHHTAGDASVLSLGAASADGDLDSGQPGKLSSMQPLLLPEPPAVVLSAAAAHLPWAVADVQRWGDCDSRRLERPPRA